MKVLMVSLGCDKNLVDSEVMLGLLHKAGHEITNMRQRQLLSIPVHLSKMRRKKVLIR